MAVEMHRNGEEKNGGEGKEGAVWRQQGRMEREASRGATTMHVMCGSKSRDRKGRGSQDVKQSEGSDRRESERRQGAKGRTGRGSGSKRRWTPL